MSEGQAATGPAADAPLAWGQENYWYVRFLRTEGSSKIATSWAVPPGVSPERTVAVVQRLIHRHESLRTTFPLAEHGRPVQRVHPPRPVDVPFLPLDDGVSLRDMTSRYAAAPMDPETAWPVRFALVTSRGRPYRLIVVLNHIAADGAGVEALWRDFVALLGGTPEAGQDDPARTPSEQARIESGASLREHRRRGLTYLEGCFAQAPRALFPAFRPMAEAAAEDGKDLYHKAALRSLHLHASAERLARRHRTLPSLVYATAYAVLLRSVSGHDRMVLMSSFANRPPELEPVVGCFFQRSPLRVDLSGALTTSAAARAVKLSMLDAWEHAHHSYFDMREAKARVEQRRGHPVRLGVGYNYFSSEVLSQAWYIEPRDEPDGAVRWVSPGKTDDALDLHLEVLLDGSTADLSLLAHRSVLDRETTGALLTAVSELILRWDRSPASADPTWAALTGELGFPKKRFPESWRYADGSWVNLPRLADCLREAEGVTAADVFAVPAAGAPGTLEIEAYAAAPQVRLDPVALREHLRGAVAAHEDLIAPHRIFLSDAPPDGHGLAAWRRLPGTAHALGPIPSGRPPQNPTEKALIAAIRAYNPDAAEDVDSSYLTGGGRAVTAVAVVRELSRSGHVLAPEELLAPVPLWSVAARLDRNPCPRPPIRKAWNA